MEQKTEIEYETVTIKLPKKVIEFLRNEAKEHSMSLEENVEWDVVEMVRSLMEGISGENFARLLGFGPIFWEILSDNRYKPADAEPKNERLAFPA